MARDFAGVDDSLTGSALVTAPPLTMVCWGRIDVLGGNKSFISLGTAGSNDNRYTLYKSTSDTIIARSRDTGNDDSVASSAISVDTWYHLGAVFTSSSERYSYVNGVTAGSGGGVTSAFTPDEIRLGNSGNDLQDLDGKMAETAVWNVALTAAEMLSLAEGYSPDLIRPANRVSYWNLFGNNSPETDRWSGDNLTINGTVTKFPHPRVIMPSPQRLFVPSAVGPITTLQSVTVTGTGTASIATAIILNQSISTTGTGTATIAETFIAGFGFLQGILRSILRPVLRAILR